MIGMRKYILRTFQNITQIVKKTSYSFNNYYKRRKTAFSCGKKLSPSLRGIASKNNADFFLLELSSLF